ncbi:hypothetical protein A7A08_02619 [Methyloligella halotolerans]|uniref:Ava_C0101 and related proteins n=1 Tax=Methyloligella halotolerans TaxID=1177755 RepID=A0A1E2RW59_9HYPH|nr:DUF5996 family protein [Methyloligella halotolerans]ODA66496.1 hypothetical protein A7A08_02619 [Methyloligella halotolerans]
MNDRIDSIWPALSYAAEHETYDALHLMTQIVGKIRLARTPWINHSWHVTLYLSAVGLSTGPNSYPQGAFDLEFDLIRHRLSLRTSDGGHDDIPLNAPTIADFHAAVVEMLANAGIAVEFDGVPNELPDAVPFAEDDRPRRYDPDAAHRLWRVWLKTGEVFTRFRSGFIGKVSPVHFFWGSFDLAVTRFSGRPAPLHPGGVPNLPDDVAQEAYSHEVSSAGFWSGGPTAPFPLFYSYAYPEPPGFREAKGLPDGAGFDGEMGEYVMPYEAVRTAADPDTALLQFLQQTYAAAADGARWDRAALECEIGRPGVVRPV